MGKARGARDHKVRQDQVVRDRGSLKRVNFLLCAVRNLHMILFFEKGVARPDLWLANMNRRYSEQGRYDVCTSF